VLAVGARAPDFALKDQNNQLVTLSSFRDRSAVLLVFYPLAFTGTCGGELAALQTSLPSVQNASVQVLTVSVDSAYSHKVWAQREGWGFPMLADFWPHGGVAAAYGVFNDAAGFADRGTFLIDRTGVIRFAEHVGPGEARDVKRWIDEIGRL
jgi:peroxiredoxin (alkyl hydroperoxide reductase subunit C)